MKTRVKVWFVRTAKPNPYGTGCAVVAADSPASAKRLSKLISSSWGFFGEPWSYEILDVAYDGKPGVLCHAELEPSNNQIQKEARNETEAI